MTLAVWFCDVDVVTVTPDVDLAWTLTGTEQSDDGKQRGHHVSPPARLGADLLRVPPAVVR